MWTDNVSVMLRINNGVHKMLNEECGLKDVTLFCCEVVLSMTPVPVLDLVRKLATGFQCLQSTGRPTINCEEKLLQTEVCATRWLSI